MMKQKANLNLNLNINPKQGMMKTVFVSHDSSSLSDILNHHFNLFISDLTEFPIKQQNISPFQTQKRMGGNMIYY